MNVKKALGLALLLSGCGDGLLDDRFVGALKLEMRGQPGGAYDALDADRDHVRASIFWLPKGLQKFGGLSDLVEQPSTGIQLQVPFGFRWGIYDEPEPQHFAMGPKGERFALGMPLVYADRNGNHRRDDNEPFFGRAPVNLVLRAPQEIAAAMSPTGVKIPEGFHVISGPVGCPPMPSPAPNSPDQCGVKIGARCDRDSLCGAGGVCLLGDPWPWPEGMCALPEPAPNGCRPSNAALWRNHKDIGKDYWVADCAHCDRGQPFHCDLNQGACLPTASVQLLIEAAPKIVSVCRPMSGMQPPPPPP